MFRAITIICIALLACGCAQRAAPVTDEPVGPAARNTRWFRAHIFRIHVASSPRWHGRSVGHGTVH